MCNIRPCVQYFHTQTERESHVNQKHLNQIKKRKIKCPECSYRCVKKSRLERHLTRMHQVKDKPCPKCAKLFGSFDAVRDHIRTTHAAIERCPHCNVKFTTLVEHQSKRKCAKCQQVLLCGTLARLHYAKCRAHLN